MKINLKNGVPFEKLFVGETFKSGHGIAMKIPPMMFEEDSPVNAIDLEHGIRCYYPNDFVVEKCECELNEI